MGCLDLLGLQNLSENVPMALYLVLLLLAVFCINFLYYIVLRVSSCVLPPCLTLVRWSLQSVAGANIIAACIGIPHDIFLHTRKFWNVDSGICTFIVVVDCWYHTGIVCVLLFCTADRFIYYKFPPLYKRFTQRTSWMALALLLTWLIAAVFSLPIAASISNSNGNCDQSESSHKVCRPFSDAGMAAYQFMAVFLLPTGFSILLIVITWKAEFSSALSKHKPKEITLHKTGAHFQPVGGRYRSDVFDEEFYFDDDPEEQNLKMQAERYIQTNTDLLTNLPPATTRFTTLPRLDSAARLHIQRMQLESRASTIGDCSDRVSSPVLEAWPDDHHGDVSIYSPPLVGGRNVSSPVAVSGCNLSLSSRQMQSPQPQLREMKSPPPARSITPVDGVSAHLSGSSQTLTSPTQDEPGAVSSQEVTKGIRPYTPALTPVEQYAQHSHTHSRFAKFAPRPYSRESGGATQPNQREKQRLARLRQKWKKSSLKQNAALPPIPGSNKIDPNHSEIETAKEDMRDLTVPFCEKTAFKLVVLNVLLLLGLSLPLELGHVIASSCATCNVPITLWNFVKSLTHVFALLSPLVSCHQHPALNHTAWFLVQFLKKRIKPSQ